LLSGVPDFWPEQGFLADDEPRLCVNSIDQHGERTDSVPVASAPHDFSWPDFLLSLLAAVYRYSMPTATVGSLAEHLGDWSHALVAAADLGLQPRWHGAARGADLPVGGIALYSVGRLAVPKT